MVSLSPGQEGEFQSNPLPRVPRFTLKGDAEVSGVTPTLFHYPLVGEVELIIKKFGYEDYHTRLVLDPVRTTHINVELTPKTSLKAASRSLFIPGWGQRYASKHRKGAAFSVGFALSVVAYLLADNDFNDKEDIFRSRLDEFDQAVLDGSSRNDLELRLKELNEAQNDAYDAENIRRFTIGAAIGIWGLNVLDALFTSAGAKEVVTIGGLTVVPSADQQGIRLSLTRSF